MELRFDKDPLAREQNNYATKIVNAYVFYDLNTWQEILLKISNLKIAYSAQLM